MREKLQSFLILVDRCLVNVAYIFLGNTSLNPHTQIYLRILGVLVILFEFQFLDEANTDFLKILDIFYLTRRLYLLSSIQCILVSVSGMFSFLAIILGSQMQSATLNFYLQNWFHFYHYLHAPFLKVCALYLIRFTQILYVGIIGLILSIISQLIYILLNRSYRLSELEMQSQKLMPMIINFSLDTILSISITFRIDNRIIITTLIIKNLFNIMETLHSLKENSDFLLQTKVISCIILTSEVFSLNWIESFLLLTFFFVLLKLFRSSMLHDLIINEQDLMRKQQFYENHLKKNCSPRQFFILQAYFQNQNKRFEEFSIKQRIGSKKIQPSDLLLCAYGLLFINKFKCLAIILEHGHILNYRDSLTLQSFKLKIKLDDNQNNQNIINQDQNKNSKKMSIKPSDFLIISQLLKLETEIESRMISSIECIIKLLRKIVAFENKILSSESLNKIISKQSQLLRNNIDHLHQQLDFDRLRLKNFDHTNIMVLHFIFMCVVGIYQNYKKAQVISKVIDLRTSQKQKIDKLLIQNEIVLLQANIQDPELKLSHGSIKRLQEFLKGDQPPQIINDLLPDFLKQLHTQKIKGLIEKGQLRSSKIVSYFQYNGFINPCQLKLSYVYFEDQLIVNVLLIRRPKLQDVILFNSQGKIIGISQSLYQFIQRKGEAELRFITAEQLIGDGMIQFYIPTIQEQMLNYLLNYSDDSMNQYFQGYLAFPTNHDQCLDNSKYILNYQPIPQKKLSYKEGARKLVKTSRLSVQSFKVPLDFENHFQIEMMNPKIYEKLNHLIIPGMKAKNLELEYSLSLKRISFQEGSYNYFQLKVLKLEGFEQQQPQYHTQKHFGICDTSANSNQSLNYDSTYIENFVLKKQTIKPIKTLYIFQFLLMALILFTMLFNKLMLETFLQDYENQVNFQIKTQTITFCYCATFMIRWSRISAEEGLYNMSKRVNEQRIGKLNFIENLCKSIYTEMTPKLFHYGRSYGIQEIETKRIVDGQIQRRNDSLYDFYIQMGEQFYKIFEEDEDIDLTASGFLRLNIPALLRHHEFIMKTLFMGVYAENQNRIKFIYLMILIEIVVCFCLTLVYLWLIKSLNLQTSKLVKLLGFISNSNLNERFFSVQQMKIKIVTSETTQLLSNDHRYETVDQNQWLLKSTKGPKSHIKYSNNYIYDLVGGIVQTCLLFSTLSFAIIHHLNNFDLFQQSLYLTLEYIQFKTVLDRTALLGELIKTESLIPNNPIELIDEEETITMFSSYSNLIQVHFTNVMNVLISSETFNGEKKQILLDIFSGNLCEIFPDYLPLCYSDQDSYMSVLQNGISGYVQSFLKYLKQEFSYELEVLRYQPDKGKLLSMLRQPTHQNYFLQYFQELEYPFYICFFNFQEETAIMNQEFIEQVNKYYWITGIMYFNLQNRSFLIIFLGTIIYLIKKQKHFDQIKTSLLILPASVLQRSSFSKLFFEYNKQIYNK